MTTRCCVAKFIRTLSTVISTIDLKLPLYTAGVHRVSDISIIHLFVVMCHCATSSPHLNPQVHSAHPPRLVPASGFRVTWHPLLLCLVSQISVASIVHLSEGYAQIIGPFNQAVARSGISGVQRGSRPFAGAWGRPPCSFSPAPAGRKETLNSPANTIEVQMKHRSEVVRSR